jgi:hypothetical protein
MLSSLIGYHPPASYFGNEPEKQWGQGAFERIAVLTLSQKSAHYLWSQASAGRRGGKSASHRKLPACESQI